MADRGSGGVWGFRVDLSKRRKTPFFPLDVSIGLSDLCLYPYTILHSWIEIYYEYLQGDTAFLQKKKRKEKEADNTA
jgi:hypothetical protein